MINGLCLADNLQIHILILADGDRARDRRALEANRQIGFGLI